MNGDLEFSNSLSERLDGTDWQRSGVKGKFCGEPEPGEPRLRPNQIKLHHIKTTTLAEKVVSRPRCGH